MASSTGSGVGVGSGAGSGAREAAAAVENASPPYFLGVLVEASFERMLLGLPMLEFSPVCGQAAGDFGILRA